MIKILTYHEIDIQQWKALIDRSPYATWFQTKEAYEFYTANPEEMTPFVFGVERECALRALCVGYVTKECSAIKQYFTRRAIIIGGPLIDNDATAEEVAALLNAVNKLQRSDRQPAGRSTAKRSTGLSPIYFETRNFHDYSRWKEVFKKAGFNYHPHLNFHVDTSSVEMVDKNLGKSRKRDIRTTIRDGVTPVYQPTIDQVKEYYQILLNLYTTKVKTPLFSWNFFEQLHRTEYARFILTEYQGRIIGGTVCVELPNRTLYEWFACGKDGLYDHIYPSCYATYLGIKYAAEAGCQIFDMMGAGKPDEAYGVRDFKAKFGGELVEHGRFLCIRKPLLDWIGKTGVKILKRDK